MGKRRTKKGVGFDLNPTPPYTQLHFLKNNGGNNVQKKGVGFDLEGFTNSKKIIKNCKKS